MKILKWVGLVLVFLALMLGIFLYSQSESKPVVNQTPEADKLAQDMLTALNKPAWDSLKFLKWEFMGGHKYMWDQQNNQAIISWGDSKVHMNLDDQSGKAFENGSEVSGEKKSKLLTTAWSYWCNDSFWMFAPFKIFDPNTKRTIVNENNQKRLMVSYSGGGVTPGDSYLWLLDQDNIPTAYKMWVKIIPVGGMEVSWEGWKTLPGGAKIATSHKSVAFSFDMKDVEEGNSWEDFGLSNPAF